MEFSRAVTDCLRVMEEVGSLRATVNMLHTRELMGNIFATWAQQGWLI